MEVVDRRQHTPQLKENDGPLQVPETGFASCWGTGSAPGGKRFYPRNGPAPEPVLAAPRCTI